MEHLIKKESACSILKLIYYLKNYGKSVRIRHLVKKSHTYIDLHARLLVQLLRQLMDTLSFYFNLKKGFSQRKKTEI